MTILPIFIPQAGCPTKCVYCNQIATTGINKNTYSYDDINSQIVNYLSCCKSKSSKEIAFYGSNYLGLPIEFIKKTLDISQSFINKGFIESIRFSTRPDSIKKSIINLLQNYAISTIEIGVQSMDDNVLSMSNRVHTSVDTIKAVELLQRYNYKIGMQIMVGLPGEDNLSYLKTAYRIINLKPQFVRIHPTIILKGSLLHKWFKKNQYIPLSLNEAVEKVKKMYLLFNANKISVIRMGLQPSKSLQKNFIDGPFHPAFGHLVHSKIFFDKAECLIKKSLTKDINICVNPRSISKLKGLKNENINTLLRKYNLKSINISTNDSLQIDSVKLLSSLNAANV